MKKLYINSGKYVRIGNLIIAAITLMTIFVIVNLNSNERTNPNSIWILPTIGFGISLLIGKFRFLYRAFERTDNSTICFYNNFFGLKLNKAEYPLESVNNIRRSQDRKNYYLLELVMSNGSIILLGRFAVKSQLESFELAATQLIKI
jgi:hypothetical protein